MKFLKSMKENGVKEMLSAGESPIQQEELPGIGASRANIEAISPRALYVSTSLDLWEPAQPGLLARDVTLNGVTFRRLDPEYCAWLRHKLTLAEKALEAGKIAYETYDTLLVRFNEVHMRAVDKFGMDNLTAAMESADRKKYVPPGMGSPIPSHRARPRQQTTTLNLPRKD